MAAKHTITVQAPNGDSISTNVSAAREIGAVRLIDFGIGHISTPWPGDTQARYMVTVHKSEDNAEKSFSVPSWKSMPRTIIAV